MEVKENDENFMNAGDQNALGRLAAGQFVLAVLLHREAVRLALFQALEHIIHRVHKVFVVLFHLHACLLYTSRCV